MLNLCLQMWRLGTSMACAALLLFAKWWASSRRARERQGRALRELVSFLLSQDLRRRLQEEAEEERRRLREEAELGGLEHGQIWNAMNEKHECVVSNTDASRCTL